MRFARAPRVITYEPTSRKLHAAARRLRLDREKFPLFAAEIAESQPTPDELLEARGRGFEAGQRSRRSMLARHWWEARRQLRALPPLERNAFIRYWNRSKYPGDGSYFCTVLNMFRDGRLIMHEGEVKSRSDVEWERDRKAKIAGMTDAELDAMIQTHFSPLFVEWGREERRRRFEALDTVVAAPSRRRRRRLR